VNCSTLPTDLVGPILLDLEVLGRLATEALRGYMSYSIYKRINTQN
jgi:hypothetical protein